ncbi:MAG TPA: AmmeMemoRadiSam system radical SAM enzyme [Thermoproteales archaeon]|nr:AmmeMemoRadiSam system radical SAM enzyme [Thermoproteales archaeon]
MKEALWYEKLSGNRVRCRLCPWNCLLSPGQIGLCLARMNIKGVLYALNYGIVSSIAIDPIEKKPLFHFYPGSPILSISTFGCNHKCPWCQNWEISQTSSSEKLGTKYEPEDIIKIAERYNVPFIAYTYNEPLIWYEFVLDVAKLAKKKNIKNVLVTNGHINPEPLEELLPYIDAANIDIKAFNKDTYLKIIRGKLEAVLATAEEMKSKGVHVETTHLVIPGVNDREEEFKKLVEWQIEKLGEETPLHISRFYPHYKYIDRDPTPIPVLEKFRKIALEEGLKYVYLGNLPGHEGEVTYCPKCGKPVIKRIGFVITEWNLTEDNKCKFCGAKVDIVGKRWGEKKTYWWNYIF